MYPVRIEWLSPDKGGRKSIPREGKYYSVSRFPEDEAWQSNAWSVVFELKKKKVEGQIIVSYGTVDFLMDKAPKERMEKYDRFEIYEGPKKVANVFLLHP
ncbi:hypothetical protein AHS81_21460 [Salmonella enterica]|nr:hypothetical protein [Salmonella enterica]EAM8766849.1 hypothetical protein [Salmonella enterica]EAP0380166.1 hypothetical protein [Salmonella enterica]EBQ7677694.1 hypothetical protein [Salmonella enterica]